MINKIRNRKCTISLDGKNNISIINNKLYINGKEYIFDDKGISDLEIKGEVEALETDCSISINGNVSGDVDVGGSINIVGDVTGDIDAGGSINITGSHKGDIDAGGSVLIKGGQ